VNRRSLRSRRTREELDVRALLAVELVCVLTWAMTGVAFALFAALAAGLGLVLAAMVEEDPPERRRRVR
jgi:hypothetical protein